MEDVYIVALTVIPVVFNGLMRWRETRQGWIKSRKFESDKVKFNRLSRMSTLVGWIHNREVYLALSRRHKPEEVDFDNEIEADSLCSNNRAELRGLAFAIGDKPLLALVNEGYRFIGLPEEDRYPISDEMDIRSRSQKLYTRISQLQEEHATGEKDGKEEIK